MGKIIAVVNQKGGVGKTTTCVSLVAALKEQGKRVLLCDFDPQANATSGMGVDKTLTQGIYDVLINGIAPEKRVAVTKYGDVLPSCKELAGAGIEMIAMENREMLLRNALQQIAGNYDYIFIDCPPSLGLLTLNALAAADGVIIPMQCEYYAMEGLADLVTTMKLTKRRFNPDLEIEGILFTMYDRRLLFSGQVAREIKKYFPGAVYSTVVPRNVRIAEAPSHGMPVGAYSRMSRGATAYDCLAIEFFRHNHTHEI